MHSEHDFENLMHNRPENLSVTSDAAWLGAALLVAAGLAFLATM